eukprot:8218556-Pyramimonas_sp.AAC.1
MSCYAGCSATAERTLGGLWHPLGLLALVRPPPSPSVKEWCRARERSEPSPRRFAVGKRDRPGARHQVKVWAVALQASA